MQSKFVRLKDAAGVERLLNTDQIVTVAFNGSHWIVYTVSGSFTVDQRVFDKIVIWVSAQQL